ncbi:hypothetical protein OKW09_001757 [Pseudomonas rhodesiae]|nr:hypothetical protein [Pseudomonas rhodesiae]MDF9769472.1 hypothetical protein [Pseudomonas rhodesiae]
MVNRAIRVSLAVTLLAGAVMGTAVAATPSVAVAPQYDTSHVYVAPADVDRFAQSFLATFGGKSTPQVVVNVLPVPSSTTSQLLQTPAGTVSLFGFTTPIPHPFGQERNGYLVKDMDVALKAARENGAAVIVSDFPDPIGRDAVVQWPGGVNMQLYWHTKTPDYAAFQTVPENRVYLSADRADAFIKAFLGFSPRQNPGRQPTGTRRGRRARQWHLPSRGHRVFVRPHGRAGHQRSTALPLRP